MLRAWAGSLLLMVGAGACAVPYQAGPAGPITSPRLADWHPARERYVLAQLDPALLLHARAIQLEVNDSRTVQRKDAEGDPVLRVRTSEEPVPVSLHREFVRVAAQRLDQLLDHDAAAPALKLLVRVKELRALSFGDVRQVRARLELQLQTADGQLLSSAVSKEGATMNGPPYDLRELDDVHLGACIAALESLLSDDAVAKLNERLTALSSAQPEASTAL